MKLAIQISSSILCLSLWMQASHADMVPALIGYINTSGNIVVRARGDTVIQTVGLRFGSESQKLIPIPPGDLTASSAPFSFLLANSADEIVYGNLQSLADIAASELILEAGYEGNPCGDLVVQWGNGDVPIHPVGAMLPPSNFGFCTIPGDTDFDGKVEFQDFLVLSSNFGAAPADWPMGDFDFDGKVAFSDFLQLSVNFGVDAVQWASVPEPSGHVGIWGIAFWWLIGLRSRRED